MNPKQMLFNILHGLFFGLAIAMMLISVLEHKDTDPYMWTHYMAASVVFAILTNSIGSLHSMWGNMNE